MREGSVVMGYLRKYTGSDGKTHYTWYKCNQCAYWGTRDDGRKLDALGNPPQVRKCRGGSNALHNGEMVHGDTLNYADPEYVGSIFRCNAFQDKWVSDDWI